MRFYRRRWFRIAAVIIVLLGIWRAGLIAAPMPLLWRQADAVAALGKVTPRALVAVRRVADTDHSEIAMHLAAEIFAVRYVCGFGPNLPDGVIGLDHVFEAASPIAPSEQIAVTPQDRAFLTFELRSQGALAVPHTHAELMVAGSAVVGAAAPA